MSEYPVSPYGMRRLSWIILILLAAGLSLLLLLRSARAGADSVLLVDGGGPCSDGSGDPAYCTIQAAVDAAPDDSLILVANGTYLENVSLGSPISLTISGAGIGQTIVDGSRTDVVFDLPENSTVALEQLTIQNGMATRAGGIINRGDLTLDTVLVSNNSGEDSGGVFSGGYSSGNGATLVARDSQFIANTSSFRGGGVGNWGGEAWLYDSTISLNTAVLGGGLANIGGQMGVDQVTLAQNLGGGIFNGTYTDFSFIDLTATPYMTISHNTVITANTASASTGGGGLLNAGVLTMTDSNVLSNTSGAEGGGIFNEGTAVIVNSAINENVSYRFGGGIRNLAREVGGAQLSLTGSAVQSNTAAVDPLAPLTSGGAGGISNSGGDLTLVEVNLSYNRANNASGGLYSVSFVDSGTGQTITGSLFISGTQMTHNKTFPLQVDNESRPCGGARIGHPLIMYNSLVAYNEASFVGGGLCLSGSFTMTNVTVSSNVVYPIDIDQSYGGGIEAVGGSIEGRLNYSTISANTANYGAGIESYGGVVLVNSTVISGNYGSDIFGSVTCLTCPPFVDLMLSGLADNGGGTLTHMPQPGSPLIDSGDAASCPATDQRGVPRPQGGGCDMGAVEVEQQTAVEQCIPLAAGWNMASAHVDVDSPNLDALAEAMGGSIVLLKNGLGQVYWPAMGIDEIVNWNPLDGYQIYMESSETLCLSGEPVPYDTPIPLLQGWSLVSYLPDGSTPPNRSFGSIEEALRLAKDGMGQVYWPIYGVSQIGEMVPGQGYQLYLQSPGTLTYPFPGP